MGTIDWGYTYPYIFISNYKLTERSSHKHDNYDYNYAFNKFNPPLVQIKRNKAIFQFFPKEMSVFLQPLTRSYNVINNIVSPCECKSLTIRQHLAHIPLLAVNDTDPKINLLAKLLLDEPDTLYELLLGQTEPQKMQPEIIEIFLKISAVHPFLLKTSKDIRNVIQKLQTIQFFNEDYQTFIQRGIDQFEQVFLYLEPPFYTENAFNEQFDYKKLVRVLSTLPSSVQWVLTCNNHQTIRDWFQQYDHELIQMPQSNLILIKSYENVLNPQNEQYIIN